MGIAAKFGKIKGYIKDYGINYAIKKIYYRFEIKYIKGKKYCPFEISEEQRKAEEAYKSTKSIKISIVVPLYNTPIEFLKDMIESVRRQTYTNWELCLADASEDEYKYVEETVKKYAVKDVRIKYKHLGKNQGISINSNEAVKMAAGEYMALLDHDDLIHPSALYYVVKAIEEENAEFVYTDELSFDGTPNRVQSINFKPDFSWETFRYNNFICHLAAFKREMFEDVGGFSKECEGAQDYDLFFKLLEKTDKVVHIQKVLYYWRVYQASSASGINAKPYIINAGIRAVESHLKRKEIEYDDIVSEYGHGPFYRVNYKIAGKKRVRIYAQDEALKDSLLEKIIKDERYTVDVVVIKNKNFIEELKKDDELAYDIIILARSGYKMHFNENDGYNGFVEELIRCLETKENQVVSNTVINEKGRYENAGWSYNIEWKDNVRPLCKNVSVNDSGYMNRLHFRQTVSLLDGSMLAMNKDIFIRWYDKKGCSIHGCDVFSRKSWFEICMENEKTGGNSIITPYYPAVENRRIPKNEKKYPADIKFDGHDRYINRGMEKFGREYLLW